MTETFQVEVENIKCGGCENSIVRASTAWPKFQIWSLTATSNWSAFLAKRLSSKPSSTNCVPWVTQKKAPLQAWRQALPTPNPLSVVPLAE